MIDLNDGKVVSSRSMRPRLTIVAGARPNFMKIAPIISAIRHSAAFRFVHTGQHYDHRLSGAIIDELQLPSPDTNLQVGSGTHSAQMAATMLAFEQDLIAHPPDAVLVAGDVNSTLACSLTAAQLQIPVAHVEAGLRSNDWTMPEEMNRVLTDRLSQWLFTSSRDADDNLAREGIDNKRIHFVGNTMIDSLFTHLPQARRKAKGVMLALEAKSPFALVTLHRSSNVDDPRRLSGLLAALGELAEIIPLVFPLHPRTARAVNYFGLKISAKISTCEALTYLEFLGLVEQASLVLTDSGGVQEETSALGVPCLTLRTTTERPVTCELGTNKLIGIDPKVVLHEAIEALNRPRTPTSIPLWDGRSARRVTDILLADLMRG